MVASRGLKVVLGGVALAGVLYAILAMPGFLSDSASTLPSQHRIATVRS